jgi:glutamate dehydrogenase
MLTNNLTLKVYNFAETIAISDVLPILEGLGLRVISERPYALHVHEEKKIWINEFGISYAQDVPLQVDQVKEQFQDAFKSIWFHLAENDGFNRLVLSAGLSWREVAVLRAYAKYFKQIQFTFSQEYIENALNKNIEITRLLVKLFHTRLSNKADPERLDTSNVIVKQLLKLLDGVANRDEDKIIRRYIEVMQATLRTNFYQTQKNGKPKHYISLKFDPTNIPDIPLPKPMYEIFVYSPQFEGVHLRAGLVARGGLRWSDRKEDFRTEILGLMKAQQVKNSVIVPSGAKGGFVPKNLPENGSREDIMAEGINCYKSFIKGLLDVTDNYQGEAIIKPKDVYCYDGDDPYLVVAADKGTATFSDIANDIATKYQFWLGDAFASGGSMGYDHKKMGITARGAWESVKRHFRELGRNIQESPFTVVGVGDMAGDVFGNGMLLSECIQLVGAFNHLHIFIDPEPDPAKTYLERKRLFELPRSTWKDFDAQLISKGGGIFDRSAKSITLTPEIKKVFDLEVDQIEPNDLIRAMLKSKVDLLWSGGIGTFVKAEKETHNEVGDRTNDGIRVNAHELNCKVVGEGGNLGLTQLARIDFAMHDGYIFTDFIDNSAGVDCSDNEVNIKILLNGIVNNGDMTEKQRNQLLESMTNEVSELVLNDNYQQTQAISLAAAQALRNVELHGRYIDYLERTGKLDRNLEFIPDAKTLMERKLVGQGLLRPGLAVLLCYSKILINEQILSSEVPEDPSLASILIDAFPKPLRQQYAYAMSEHKLRREIIATKLSNIIVNEMGFTFVYRLQDETGAPTSAIVRAYMIARTIFCLPERWKEIQGLDNQVSTTVQAEMMMQYIRLLRRSTRWFLRSNRMRLDIASTIDLYGPGVQRLREALPNIISKKQMRQSEGVINELFEKGVPSRLGEELALCRAYFSALDIIEAAHDLSCPIEDVAEVYFSIGEFLDLNWIRTQVIIHPTENHWEALSREALRDDIDWQQRQLAAGILRMKGEHLDSLADTIKCWSVKYEELIERWKYILADLRSSNALNYTMFFVAIRELLDLTQTTMQQSADGCVLNQEGA